MREQMEQRLAELSTERQQGQQMLAELDARQADLRQTLLRIAGAIQVLEELLAAGPPPPGAAAPAGTAIPVNGAADVRA